MFNMISSMFSRGDTSSLEASNRTDSGFWGSRESTMDVDGLTSSMASLNNGLTNGVNRGEIVLTAGIGTGSPLPNGQGIPDMHSETRVVTPGVGVEQPVSTDVQNQNSGRVLGHITISNEPVTPPTMTINVRCNGLNNKNFPCKVKTNAKVEDLMAKIEEKRGIPPDQQRLLYAGKQLKRGDTLESYGLKDGSTVDQFERLRGG